MKPDGIKLGLRGVAAGLLAMALMGCATGGYDDAYDNAAPPARMASALPHEDGATHIESPAGQQALQCVPYARAHSQIKITGDAWTWWDQAAGKYERGSNPAPGTVMVLTDYAGPQRGHVAVVRAVVSAREIRVDHANWLDDGSIYVNDPVADVSAANDWSQVKVWNIKTGGWGVKVFPVQGFIGPGSASDSVADGRAAPRDASMPGDGDSIAQLSAANPDESPAPGDPPRRSDDAIVLAAAATRTARPVPAPNPPVPVAAIADDRNPAADSGFALTDQDRAIP